jgi:very-short-patch-repair endonuclease
MDVHAKVRKADADATVARIAARQHGVVSLAQLERAGIRRQGRTTRLRRGRLHRVHRAVFAVGHPGLSREGHWMAAVLALGPGTLIGGTTDRLVALSHTSAGALWGIVGSRGRAAPHSVERPIHVTVNDASGSRPGIRVHRARTLMPAQITLRLGIPVTTPSRTLVDLRSVLPPRRFAAAFRQAEFLGLPLDPALEPDRTRSELEGKLLALCRRHRLPQPEVNVRIGPFTVDFLWRDRHLVVEVDGFRAHGTRSAFESDRARDVELRLLGYEVLRFTWRQLTDRSPEVARALRQLLHR